MNAILYIALLASCASQCFSQNIPVDQPPPWAKDVVWYQIFVERFYNGDPTNDPKPENVAIPALKVAAPPDWAISPWTGDWYEMEPWAAKTGRKFNMVMGMRRYGGDLQGVLNKLDYLKDLGVTALFFNPINNAPSLHKYDATHYHHVDVNFGPDPVGDTKLIDSETPNNPETWKWTVADKMFLKLVQEAHKRNMKVIMDFSWNHTGTNFWAWQDILKNQTGSVYKDWFDIKTFDNPATAENEFSYRGWAGVPSLPEIRKVDVTTPKTDGHPYEGNIDPGAKQHILAVTKRWLAPDGNTQNGIDGFRLDVADQLGLGFWREYRTYVRSIQPSAYLVGEIWWEKWPNALMNPVPYTKGDVFDAVMFYQIYRPARYFFANTDFPIDAKQFKDSLELQWNRLRPETRLAMMNVSSSHDTPRLLTDFYNRNKYKYNSNPSADATFKTGKPDKDAYERLKLYLVFSFTGLGAPNIWNGEEMGMWGADDPFNRKPLMWKEYQFKPETRNNFQPGTREYDEVGFNQELFDHYRVLARMRNAQTALRSGNIRFLVTDGKKLAYERWDDKGQIVVCFNLDSEPLKFDFPARRGFLNLVTNKPLPKGPIVVNPMQALILKVL